MSTAQKRETIKLYAALMAEAKFRLQSIEYAANDVSGLLISREYCLLQLRMLCEIVALGCLAAHGDVPGTQSRKSRDEYRADKIISALDRLHPRFYPQPITMTKSADGTVQMRDATVDHLSKDELLKTYRMCGESLHRGSMRKLATWPPKGHDDLSEIVEVAGRFMNLLGAHAVVLLGDECIILCTLNTGPEGRIQVSIAPARQSGRTGRRA